MLILDWLKKLLGPREKTPADSSIYGEFEEIEEIHSIWNYLKAAENTQAGHILAVLGFEEWISMDEILRRIKEIFRMDYKNDRSLYPYIKTLVDIGLVETTSVGGRKKWRKKDVLIKLAAKTEKKAANAEKEVAGVAGQR